MGQFFEDLARTISFFFDKIVYGFVNTLYELFMNISQLAIFSQDTIQKFTVRIYVLIGIFMIFKITVSLISWYANPDTINDSKTGSGTLIKRVIISLVCLACVPWVFTNAFKVQYVILNENIIGNIVLGGMTSSDPKEAYKNGGQIMRIRTFQGFFYPE